MNWLLVFLGGGAGACCRFGLARLLPPSADGFPWATYLANLLACIVLGLCLGAIIREQLPRGAQLLLITGFCGGFSTFSTFAAELAEQLQTGQPVMAALYLLGSVVMGVLSIVAVIYLTASLPG